MRFSILQLLAFVTLAAIAVFLTADRWIVKYPYSIEDATSLYGHWKFEEFVGSCEGPYHRVGVSQSSPLAQLRLTWVQDGVEHLHEIQKSTYDSELVIVTYVNKSGDRFFALFQEHPTEASSNN